MGANLDLRWTSAAGSAIGSLGVRHANTSGTPIVSCVRRDLGEGSYSAQFNGQYVADVYTLTFSGTTVYVNAALGDANPYHNPTTGVTIVKDDATPNDLVIGGLRIVFSSGTGDTDEAVVAVGAYLTAGGVATSALNFGAQKNDGEVYAFQATVVNSGDRTAANAVLLPLPGSYYTGAIAETHIARIGPHSDDDRAALAPAGSLAMTFDTWTNQGAYYTANINIGGSLCIATAKFDGETIYEYGSGNGYVDATDRMKGLQVVFALVSASPVGETVAIVTASGWAWAMIAESVGSSPGSYQNTSLELGDIAASESIDVWIGWQVPEGQARGSLRLWTPRIRYLEV